MKKDKSIFIKNIYYMLSYAFSSLRQLDDEWIATETFENIHSLFAAILSKGIGRQLKQGLYREYLHKNEDLMVMRGKINVHGTFKNRTERKQHLNCDYDELSENNLLNQILKTTAIRLIRDGRVDVAHRGELKKVLLFFSNVDEIDIAGVHWSTIRFQRNNQTYRMIISICQLIVEGMLLTTEEGVNKLANFVDDQRMHRLFERFVLEYYAKEHPKLKVRASQIPWALDDGVGTLLPIMQSDIMLENKSGDTVLIIDTKYYSRALASNKYDSRTVRSNHLYQIFTYVKNKDKELGEKPHTVSGMLLYAKTDEEIQPDQSYEMSGNKISVRSLDLNLEFLQIARQLDEIVIEHFGKAG